MQLPSQPGVGAPSEQQLAGQLGRELARKAGTPSDPLPSSSPGSFSDSVSALEQTSSSSQASEAAAALAAAAANNPTGTPQVAPVEAPKPPAPASDPALVREVAQQVLSGIEVHMVAGRTQVDLGIDLGTLGQAQVELTKLPNEGVKIVFRLETADAQLAVSQNLPELVHALEQKGMTAQVDLQRGDGSPLGGGRHGQGQEQPQGRSRGEYLPLDEEEPRG
jgi:flagellar hook-length control protein FliK